MFTVLLAVPAICAAQTLEVQPVAENVWTIVGETEQRSFANLANNATFGLVVTQNGAVLMDPGGSYKGAAALHDVVRSVADQQTVYVTNTGG